MKIGLLADIHGHVEFLRLALDRLHREQVERIVVLGDVIYDSRNAIETVSLLKRFGAVGVWGNHDLGLCLHPSDEMRKRFTDSVVDFFSTLEASLEFDDLLFTHTLPTSDPTDPVAYFLGDQPEDAAARARCFEQFSHRVMFLGHFHRWLAASEDEQLVWSGEAPLCIAPTRRYIVIVDAVKNGWCAVFDESANVLTPVRVGDRK